MRVYVDGKLWIPPPDTGSDIVPNNTCFVLTAPAPLEAPRFQFTWNPDIVTDAPFYEPHLLWTYDDGSISNFRPDHYGSISNVTPHYRPSV